MELCLLGWGFHEHHLQADTFGLLAVQESNAIAKKKKGILFCIFIFCVCSSKLNTLTAASTNSESALGSFQMPYFGNFSPNMRHFAPCLFKKGQIYHYHSNIFRGLRTCISMSVGPIKLFQEFKGVLIMLNFLNFVQAALLSFPFSKTPINMNFWECSDKGIPPSPGSQCGSAVGAEVEQILSTRRVAIFPIKGV